MNFFKIRSIVVSLTLLCISTLTNAQIDSLRPRIERIVGSARGNIGVAIQGLETRDTLSVNGNGRYPMQSVFKFPLVLAVLSRVDAGTLSLQQKVHVTKADIRPNTHSPLGEKYPEGNIDISLGELVSYTAVESDNNACDMLFRLIGGTKVVEKFIHGLGINDIEIVATEKEMSKEWNIQFQNWTTPAAMRQLLSTFYDGTILSPASTKYLMQLMIKTANAPGRLKGLLPKGAIVAHKTGSSGENEKGVAAATNDVGIITLPNNSHVIVVVLVSNSDSDEKTRDEVIARIAKSVWDVYTVHE